jgi:transcriptional regulator with XRE-family HTH domain
MKAREKADVIFLQALGNRIATIRKEKHLTQIELGLRCDLDRSNMRRLERGDTNPTALTLHKIAQGLAIPIKELMDFSL